MAGASGSLSGGSTSSGAGSTGAGSSGAGSSGGGSSAGGGGGGGRFQMATARAVDDQCVDGGAAPDGLKEPVSGGSADREREQKSSFAGGAARSSLEKAPFSSYPRPMAFS